MGLRVTGFQGYGSLARLPIQLEAVWGLVSADLNEKSADEVVELLKVRLSCLDPFQVTVLGAQRTFDVFGFRMLSV